MSRRKGTPCACESDPCGCGSSKGKCIRTVNNVSPDPNGDFLISPGNGIAISQTGDNEITIVNDAIASSFVAGDNIEINPSGDNLEIRLTDNPVINGTLQVNGDIIQQGAAYETHAEQVYTTNDYIYMRDGAIAGLGAGDFSGFQVKLYDGVNDGRLVIDNSGTARVGDVGDEEPLLTRDESSDLTDGDSLVWDATGFKAITQAIPSAIATALAGKENTLSITHPAGRITPGSNITVSQLSYTRYGKLVIVAVEILPSVNISANTVILTFNDKPTVNEWIDLISYSDQTNRHGVISASSGQFTATGGLVASTWYGLRIVYATND